MLQVAPGFARLLSTENIAVGVDPYAPTASFDVKSRTLTMPNWDCSDRLKDMLIGHECAHAIFTDCQDLEILLKEIFGSVNMVAKDYLNVVEDIRIDRLIQRRYAGLRRDYRAGYAEMRNRDFFGMGEKDPNTLKFIDRLNCQFKGFAGDVTFSDEETVFVNRAENTETFEEVCTLAKDIYDWCKENEGSEEVPEENGADAQQQQGVEMPSDDMNEGNDRGQGSMPIEDEDGDEDGSGSGEGGEEDGDESGAGMADDTDDGDSADSVNGSGSGDGDGTAISDSEENADGFRKTHAPAPATTQRAMDENIAGETASETVPNRRVCSLDLPLMKDINLKNIIIGHKEVIEDGAGLPGNPFQWEEFQKSAKSTVTNLAQMFERKKSAAINQRTQTAKTGRLDMTNLHKYKMTEDIFLRNKVEIKGKNHGIIMYVDWSGSMDGCMSETIAQTAITAMFCKKVGIPFRVYAFSTHTRRKNDSAGRFADPARACWGDSVETTGGFYARANDRTMNFHNFSLIELFSDKMKKADWDRMGSFLMCIGDHNHVYSYPRTLWLGGTPLNESIVAAMKVATEFRRANGVDVLNSIWITDGCGGDPFNSRRGIVQQRESGRTWSFDYEVDGVYGTDHLFRVYKDVAGGNLIGIFLDDKKSILRNIYYSAVRSDCTSLQEKFEKDGFIEQDHKGYDTYFLMNKKIAVYTGSDKMEALPEDASASRVINAFRKDLGRRTMSRPLLNTFTDKIAKEIV